MGGRPDAVLPQRPVGTTSCAGIEGADYITNPKHQLKGVWTDPTPVPDEIVTLGLAENLVDDPLAMEAQRASAHFTYDPHATYIILTPPRPIATGQPVYCGYHSQTTSIDGIGNPYRIEYSFIPWQNTGWVAVGCGMHNVNATSNSFGNGIFDSWSIVVGHEYAEAVTDPDNFFGVAGRLERRPGSENADKCAWIETQNIALAGHQFAVQPMWSNEAFDAGRQPLRRLPLDGSRRRQIDVEHWKATAAVAAAVILVLATAAGAASCVAQDDVRHDHDASDRAEHVTAEEPVHRGRGHAFRSVTTGPTTTRFYLRRDGCGTCERQPASQHRPSGPMAATAAASLLNAVVGAGRRRRSRRRSSTSRRATGCRSRSTPPARSPAVIALDGAAGRRSPQVDVSLEALVNGERRRAWFRQRASACSIPTGRRHAGPVLDPRRTRRSRGRHPGARPAGHVSTGRTSYSGFVEPQRQLVCRPRRATRRVSTERSSVSVDDPTFANAVPARIGASGTTWSVAIPTPAIGKHMLYARVDAGLRYVGDRRPSTFNVTK